MHNPYLFFKTDIENSNNEDLILPGFFNILSVKILEQLLSYLEIKDLQTLCQTNKALKQMTNSIITGNRQFLDFILTSAIKHAFALTTDLQIADSLLTQTEFNYNPLTIRKNFSVLQQLLTNKSNKNISFNPKVMPIQPSKFLKEMGVICSLIIAALFYLFNSGNSRFETVGILIAALFMVTIINRIIAFFQNSSDLSNEMISLRKKLHAQDKNYYLSASSKNYQESLAEAVKYLYASSKLGIKLVAPTEYVKQILGQYLQDFFDKFDIKNDKLYQDILEQLEEASEFKKISKLKMN